MLHVLAAEGGYQVFDLAGRDTALLVISLVIGVVSLVVAYALMQGVLAADPGSEAQQEIAGFIHEGAMAYIKRQFRTIAVIVVPLAVVVFVTSVALKKPDGSVALGFATSGGVRTACFLVGALFSASIGFLGMWIATKGNVRTTAAATREDFPGALKVAIRTGGVAGLATAGLGLLGATTIILLFRNTATAMLVGFGFGGSLLALFLRVGGGIFTKAADVGADLVGKVEAGIPEDDPRNPAVIADLVGDNVGDCAGRGADLFESTAAENIGAMILGATLAAALEKQGMGFSAGIVGVMLFPLVARAFGLLASIVGIFMVKTKEDADPMAALNRGYYITSVLAIAGFFVATKWLLGNASHPDAWWMFFICGIIGVLTSIVFVFITQYYTEYRYRPVKEIAEASQTGPATNIIAGIAIGYECTLAPVVAISIAILSSYKLGAAALPGGGLFGTAVATMGMLGTAAYILAMDTFGPITDNAGGIVEMSKQPEEIRKKTDRLDAVGNTTKALTKGYAIGSAALAAFLLFSAYLDELKNFGAELTSVNLAKPEVFVGALIGAMLVFFFSGLAIKAVGKAAYVVIQDVRAQFKEHPGIMKGTEKPDYGRTVDIVTRGALRQMIAPGLVAVATPIVVGLIFKQFGVGAEAVAALLMVGTITGIVMATFLNNSGGAWDNAKKYIETGAYGGKGSPTHKAAVVGDTVGDPFKDTAGPSLHVLIKLLATITLVLAPLFI
jgi:K(+)-stimulated pyrophosphate-energized sodium pump